MELEREAAEREGKADQKVSDICLFVINKNFCFVWGEIVTVTYYRDKVEEERKKETLIYFLHPI